MSALFIGVTMAFPMGLAGLVESHIKPWWSRKQGERKLNADRLAAAQAAYPEAPGGKPSRDHDDKLPPGVSGQSA